MRRVTFGIILALGLAGSLSAQAPRKVSLSITADRLDGYDVYGRFIYTGNVVLVIDGTEISTHSDAVYDHRANLIELGNGNVRIKLAGGPEKMRFQARRTR